LATLKAKSSVTFLQTRCKIYNNVRFCLIFIY